MRPGLEIEEPSTELRAPGIVRLSATPPMTSTGMTSMYSEAIFICAGPIFLPRYSGVRPTNRPAMNTAMTAMTSIPYSPVPTPPGLTSPSIMVSSGIMPPRAV